MGLEREPVVREVDGGEESVARWLSAMDAWALEGGEEKPLYAGVCRGVVCLESSRRGGGVGRWSVVSARPLAVLMGRVGDVVLKERGGEERGRWEDPFEGLRETLSVYQGMTSAKLTGKPFGGGAIGVFGYECRHAVERGLSEKGSTGESLWWGCYDTFYLRDGVTKRGWLVSWGLERWGAAPSEALAVSKLDELLRHWQVSAGGEEAAAVKLKLRPSWSKERYRNAFDRVKAGISAGEVYQGCLTYAMKGARREDGRALYEALRRCSPSPYGALLSLDGGEMLVSSSPERFMSVRGRRVEVRPMKGTRERGGDRLEDREKRRALEESEKDRAENVMIVDLMRNDLGRVCEVGSVRVPRLFTIERYETVHQMTSTVEGVLREGEDGLSALRASFPPGSMTGAPKVQSMKLLSEVEDGVRGWYSGVLGWVGFGGDLEVSVVIRTAEVSSREVVWRVGGGIVSDSDCEDEWEESLSKCPGPLRSSRSEEAHGSVSKYVSAKKASEGR